MLSWIFSARMAAILVAAVLHVLEEYAWPDNVPLVRHRPFCAPSHDEVPVSPQSVGVATYLMQFSSLPSGPGRRGALSVHSWPRVKAQGIPQAGR
jgi:membrane-bound metal-dependent hydrolase YbcI (DUF457 family)